MHSPRHSPRLRAPDFQRDLVSDNPDKDAFPTLVWPDGAILVGEVRWHGPPWENNRSRRRYRRAARGGAAEANEDEHES